MNHGKILLLFVLIAFILSSIGLAEEACSLADVPDWLSGTLCFNSYGDRGEIGTPREQYLYFCDFDRGTITSVEIPGTATLSSELKTGRPLLVWQQRFGWDDWGYNFPRWGMYRVKDVEYGEDEPEVEETDPPLVSPPLGGATHDGALAWLGMRDTDTVYIPYNNGKNFFLCYAPTEEGELEIQMVSVEGEEVRVYHHFPLDYRWQEWKYAISSSGKIAWLDGAYSQRMYISDGETEICFTEWGSIDDTPLGWLDDTTLLYTSLYIPEPGVGVTALMTYDLETGALSPFRLDSGKEAFLDNAIYFASAMNDEGSYLAYYRPYYTGIAVKSLKTGEEYRFDPWPLVVNDDDGDYAYSYGYADDGIRIVEPNQFIMPGLVWLPQK